MYQILLALMSISTFAVVCQILKRKEFTKTDLSFLSCITYSAGTSYQ
jgi:hypothetical protein